jgi:hypothetical protein
MNRSRDIILVTSSIDNCHEQIRFGNVMAS